MPVKPPSRALALLALLAVALATVATITLRPLDTGGTAARDRTAARPSSPLPQPESPSVRRDERPAARDPVRPRIEWRHSLAIGLPESGRLLRGVRLPREGFHFFTWDPILRQSPNRTWRRWGTDRLVRTTLRVLRDFAHAHPNAPRIGVGDLSRPHGGDFGPDYGLPGHATHQNGLDVDLYYPRVDKRERPPRSVDQIERDLAQELVDRFVAAGAERVFVGPNTGLTGPPGIVQALINHDNHVHVRLPDG
jgi:murein endopeptidase